MKKTLLNIIVFAFTIGMLPGCSSVNLNDQEAQDLIVKTLNLPQKFRQDVSGNGIDFLGEGRYYPILERAGYLTSKGNWLYGYELHVTNKGRPYYMGEGERDTQGHRKLMFKTFDIDFDKITGIAINKEQKTATIRFTLKAINITPIGRLLEKNIDNPRPGELVFKKFDNGWQLEFEQNKSAVKLVQEIFWSKRN